MNAREEWLAERRTGIGGSDAAAVLGLSPYRSRLALYLDKRGELQEEAPESDDMLWGRLLEPVVRQRYSDVTGRTVKMLSGLARHPRHPWMIGSLDGFVEGERVIYEGKTARRSDGWGEPGTDQVPEHYALQVQHYLAVTGYEAADIAVLIAGSSFRMYRIDADRELQDMLFEAEREFWEMVQRGEPPEPDLSRESDRAILRRMFPGTNGQTIRADESDERWRAVWQEAAELAAQYQATAEHAKAHLLRKMGEASQLEFSDGKALRRKLIHKKPYTVEAAPYMDARIATLKGE